MSDDDVDDNDEFWDADVEEKLLEEFLEAKGVKATCPACNMHSMSIDPALPISISPISGKAEISHANAPKSLPVIWRYCMNCGHIQQFAYGFFSHWLKNEKGGA